MTTRELLRERLAPALIEAAGRNGRRCAVHQARAARRRLTRGRRRRSALRGSALPAYAASRLRLRSSRCSAGVRGRAAGFGRGAPAPQLWRPAAGIGCRCRDGSADRCLGHGDQAGEHPAGLGRCARWRGAGFDRCRRRSDGSPDRYRLRRGARCRRDQRPWRLLRLRPDSLGGGLT